MSLALEPGEESDCELTGEYAPDNRGLTSCPNGIVDIYGVCVVCGTHHGPDAASGPEYLWARNDRS